jgi:hypothetical protein
MCAWPHLTLCSRETSSNSFEVCCQERYYDLGNYVRLEKCFFFLCYQLETYKFVLCITFFHSQKFDLSVEYNKWQKLLSGSLYEYLRRWLGKKKDK